MIRFENVSFGYSDGLILRDVSFEVAAGSVVLVHGRTGSGKSTLLQLINRLVPNFSGGVAAGSVQIAGVEHSHSKPHHLAHLVGYVGQRPEATFVADTVADELAFGMEQLGVAKGVIRERVQENAERFELTRLLQRNPADLSGGEQQRVAIAAALNNAQKVLLLDEPTSALDDASTMTLIATLTRLKAQGITVVIAEHHVQRVAEICDRYLLVEKGLLLETAKPNAQCLTQTPKLGEGSIKVLLGPNGSGKTTTLWKLQEQTKATMVPQRASDLLYLNSVAEELNESDEFHGLTSGTTSKLLDELVPGVNRALNPRDLSVGTQLALAIAVQLAAPTKRLLLDEPTRGLDFEAKQTLVDLLGQLRKSGHEITLATHDPDFAHAVADEVQVLK